MKPPKTIFVCQECGGQQQKWLGRCPDCGAWNSLVEEQPAPLTAPAAANHRYGPVSGSASAKPGTYLVEVKVDGLGTAKVSFVLEKD